MSKADCDTDALATHIWSEVLFGHCGAVERLLRPAQEA